MTIHTASRCQRCGEVLEPADTGKWCGGCQPPLSDRTGKPDQYDRMARELVKQGLASDRVIDGAQAPTRRAS